VALQQVAEAYAPDADIRIKWPNDLIAGDAKLSGILLERSGDAVICGFGVNLADHPRDLERPATSLSALSGSAPDPALFLEEMTAAFADWLSRWRSDGLASIRTRWLEKAHSIGTPLSASLPNGQRLEGLFDGLDESGALRLRLADGSLHVIQAGDVFLI
jgi:BirA family biotin operon repressor/biotin-[acetyl-CoA-carboxylase] ligase